MDKVQVDRPQDESLTISAVSSKNSASMKTISDSLPTPTQFAAATGDFVYVRKPVV